MCITIFFLKCAFLFSWSQFVIKLALKHQRKNLKGTSAEKHFQLRSVLNGSLKLVLGFLVYNSVTDLNVKCSFSV